jgi:hypothetical protein
MSKIDTTLAQAGSAQKPAPAPQGKVTSLTVAFDPAFPKPPVVVVTPFWRRATAVPLPPETVKEVTTTHFVVTSINGADDYFINWIAVPTP